MYEPRPRLWRIERVRRRTSLLYSRLRERIVRWATPDLTLRVGSTASLPLIRVGQTLWAWLFRVLSRRTSPVLRPHSAADSPAVWEQPSRPVDDVSAPPAVPREADPAPLRPQVTAATLEQGYELRIRPPVNPVVLALKPTVLQSPSPRSDVRSSGPSLKRPAPGPSPRVSAVPAAVRGGATVIPIELRRIAKLPIRRRVTVIGDCENDTDCVNASLRFIGFIGKKGKLKANARGARIVQTGDLLHKKAPSASVASFWAGLRTAGAAAGCSLHLVAGNHELEIWRRLRSGEWLGLKRCERRVVLDLIRTMGLFHVEGSMLFIHGYPTVKLLRHIQTYRSGTEKQLNDYNEDCFRVAFDRPKLLARYAYPRTSAGRGSLLHDVPDPERYYRRHGREVAALLHGFGIDLVVHGHRPERSGVQKDFELQRWLPGIRMISNDTQLRLQGLGGTVIRQVETGGTDVLFVNKERSTSGHRTAVRSLLQAPIRSAGDPLGLNKAGRIGQVSSFVRDKDLGVPAVVARKQAVTV